ncbi:MAG: DinB family protein [Armatimonadetes bacterium]|nr:DinB family protein [Armatimonadota bacterium]
MNDVIAAAKRRASQAMEHFLKVLSFVPEDMLDWKPVPTAKSAFEIAAHCAGYSAGFVGVIATGEFPEQVEDFLGPIQAAIASITTREQAEAALREGTAKTLAALDTVKPEWIDSTIDTLIGPTPFLFFMTIPANHLVNHTGQLDYLQTCWDDQLVHF